MMVSSDLQLDSSAVNAFPNSDNGSRLLIDIRDWF